MPLIALTGGIAAGKSTVAARLAELGAVIVDADQIVRDVQSPGSPVLHSIADEFGDGILSDECRGLQLLKQQPRWLLSSGAGGD